MLFNAAIHLHQFFVEIKNRSSLEEVDFSQIYKQVICYEKLSLTFFKCIFGPHLVDPYKV